MEGSSGNFATRNFDSWPIVYVSDDGKLKLVGSDGGDQYVRHRTGDLPRTPSQCCLGIEENVPSPLA